jgi:uncharacterized membrane protein YbaN (DUF454 family)
MTVPAPPPARPAVRRGASRVLWLVIGMISVGLGAIGVVVPGLPTTVFFIVAAWCFARSSPRFESWVLGLPRIGPMVRDHREGLGMPRRAKVVALAMMWTAIALSGVTLRQRPVLVAVVVALGVVGSTYIAWRVPTRERVVADRLASQA